MVVLKWDEVGQRVYETGTSKGVLFPQTSNGSYGKGVAWNGLQSVKKSNDGAEENALHANNKKYLSLQSAENLKGSIDAYTYPDEFEACDGSAEVNPGVYVGQQNRVPFGLVYATVVGNDTVGNKHGEKLHFIYNAKVSPSSRDYETINEDPDAITFSWEYTTTPVDLSSVNLEASAGVVIDSRYVDPAKYQALQDIIYGTTELEPRLPSLLEVLTLTEGTVSP